MIKTLDSVEFQEVSGLNLEKATAYSLRVTKVGENDAESDFYLGNRQDNGVGAYLCDCDQWGGGDPPCDNCR